MSPETATPVDEIRTAANQIRANVAEIARPDDRWAQGPGQHLHAGYTAHVAADGDPQWSGICDVIVGSGAEKHIAAWDPTVALAVADWLDHTADDMHDNDATEREFPNHLPRYRRQVVDGFGSIRFDWTAALEVARAYAGGGAVA